MKQEIVESKCKCPKCGSKNLSLHEIWIGHSVTWQQVDGRFDRQDGVLEAGNPYKVEGECNECEYRWTVRGALQITDLIKENQEHEEEKQ